MENKFHAFVDELCEIQDNLIESVIKTADAYKYDRDMLLKEVAEKLNETLESSNYKEYVLPAEADSEGVFEEKMNILINKSAFGETQEMLNAEIDKVLDILKKSPMFTGRITLAMEISNRGKNVRPILYKTKYVPKEVIKEPQVEGQILITNYP